MYNKGEETDFSIFKEFIIMCVFPQILSSNES